VSKGVKGVYACMVDMEQYFPAYMPAIPPPSFTLRSRREVNTGDWTNSRMVEHWQSDSPALDRSKYQDMNPTASRLYREDIKQSQPFVPPTVDSDEVKKMLELENLISSTLTRIQELSNTGESEELEMKKETYKLLLIRKKQANIDTLTRNPYFDKYDVEGDTRNIIRELRSVVTEDIVDRGIAESQKLIRRGMENRWLPTHFAESQGLDSLTAYEIMKPKFNQQEKVYF